MNTKSETKVGFTAGRSHGGHPWLSEHKNPGRLTLKSQTILVPVEDFSDLTKKALHYAIPFARQMNARIIFLHVLPVASMPAWKYDWVTHDRLFDAQEQLNSEHQLAGFANEAFPTDVPVKIEVRYGAPAKNIVNTANELGADLIIMSTHDYSGWIRMLIGSVASKVVRWAPCPVLVVREHENDFVLDEHGVLESP
jgi:universal stress protein A